MITGNVLTQFVVLYMYVHILIHLLLRIYGIAGQSNKGSLIYKL